MALKLGSLDHIALDLPGNPLGLQRDDLVFEKASGIRTAALHRPAGTVTASRCCPEVPAPQPQPPRTSPMTLPPS